MTPRYTYLYLHHTDISLKQLGDCLGDISGWMPNKKLRFNANKTDFIIIGTSRQWRSINTDERGACMTLLVAHMAKYI